MTLKQEGDLGTLFEYLISRYVHGVRHEEAVGLAQESDAIARHRSEHPLPPLQGYSHGQEPPTSGIFPAESTENQDYLA